MARHVGDSRPPAAALRAASMARMQGRHARICSWGSNWGWRVLMTVVSAFASGCRKQIPVSQA